MNSGKAEVKLGFLSFLGLMILSLSVGQIARADGDELKLINRASKKRLETTFSEADQKKWVNWLVTDFKKENVTKLVTEFGKKSYEPIKFAKALVAAKLEAIRLKTPDFDKNITDEFKKIAIAEFDGDENRKDGLTDLVGAILSKDHDALVAANVYSRLFLSPVLRAKLHIGDEVVVADDSKKNDERFKSLEDTIKELTNKIAAPRIPAGPGAPTELSPAVKKICADMEKLRKDAPARDAQFKEQIEGALKGLLENNQKVNPALVEQKKNEQILADALKNLLNDQKREDRNPFLAQNTPPPQAQPTQPQQASRAFDKDAPPAQEQAKRNPFPYFPTQESNEPIEVAYNIPLVSGVQPALNEADSRMAEFDGKAKITPNGRMDLGTLLRIKNEKNADVQKLTSSVSRLKKQKRELRNTLEPLRQSVASTLSPDVKAKKDELETQIGNLENRLQQARAAAGSAQDEDSQEQVAGMLTQMQGEINTKKSTLARLDKTIKREGEAANIKVKRLADQEGDLDDAISNLEQRLATAKTESETFEQLASAKTEQMFKEAEGRFAPQQGPRTTNANSIGSYPRGGRKPGGVGNAFRGGLGLESAMSAEQRKPLSGNSAVSTQ